MGLNLLNIVLKIKGMFSKKMKVSRQQVISFTQFKAPCFPILDLGGGGEGVIGQLCREKVTALDLRQDELDEAPLGPIKVCGDARNMPFEEKSFESATAFYFFLYVLPSDHLHVLKETYRILRPGGILYIWDSVVSVPDSVKRDLFVVPVTVVLPEKTVNTAYGVSWKNHPLSLDDFRNKILEAGFQINQFSLNEEAFYFECQKM